MSVLRLVNLAKHVCSAAFQVNRRNPPLKHRRPLSNWSAARRPPTNASVRSAARPAAAASYSTAAGSTPSSATRESFFRFLTDRLPFLKSLLPAAHPSAPRKLPSTFYARAFKSATTAGRGLPKSGAGRFAARFGWSPATKSALWVRSAQLGRSAFGPVANSGRYFPKASGIVARASQAFAVRNDHQFGWAARHFASFNYEGTKVPLGSVEGAKSSKYKTSKVSRRRETKLAVTKRSAASQLVFPRPSAAFDAQRPLAAAAPTQQVHMSVLLYGPAAWDHAINSAPIKPSAKTSLAHHHLTGALVNEFAAVVELQNFHLEAVQKLLDRLARHSREFPQLAFRVERRDGGELRIVFPDSVADSQAARQLLVKLGIEPDNAHFTLECVPVPTVNNAVEEQSSSTVFANRRADEASDYVRGLKHFLLAVDDVAARSNQRFTSPSLMTYDNAMSALRAATSLRQI